MPDEVITCALQVSDSQHRQTAKYRGLFRRVELLVAAVLAIAAGAKGYSILYSETGLGASHHWIVQAVLVQVEFLLATWIVTGVWAHVRRRVLTFCLLCFSVIAVYKAIRGDASCGCFGNVTVSPWATAIFDMAALAGVLFLNPAVLASRTGKQIWAGRKAVVMALSVASSILFWSAVIQRSSVEYASDPNGVLLAKQWVGRPFPLTILISPQTFSRGRWLLVLYRHDCEWCTDAVNRYASWSNTIIAELNAQLAFAEIPPYATSTSENSVVLNDYPRFLLQEDRRWSGKTPIVVLLEDGRVLAADQGETSVEPKHFLALAPSANEASRKRNTGGN